jgi:hypothetical protein
MWASPGADVGQSRRRCGPVPAPMWASPGADAAGREQVAAQTLSGLQMASMRPLITTIEMAVLSVCTQSARAFPECIDAQGHRRAFVSRCVCLRREHVFVSPSACMRTPSDPLPSPPRSCPAPHPHAVHTTFSHRPRTCAAKIRTAIDFSEPCSDAPPPIQRSPARGRSVGAWPNGECRWDSPSGGAGGVTDSVCGRAKGASRTKRNFGMKLIADAPKIVATWSRHVGCNG